MDDLAAGGVLPDPPAAGKGVTDGMLTELIALLVVITGITTAAITTAAAIVSRMALRPSTLTGVRKVVRRICRCGGAAGVAGPGDGVGLAGPDGGADLRFPRGDAWSLRGLGRAYLSLSALPRPNTVLDLTPGEL